MKLTAREVARLLSDERNYIASLQKHMKPNSQAWILLDQALGNLLRAQSELESKPFENA